MNAELRVPFLSPGAAAWLAGFSAHARTLPAWAVVGARRVSHAKSQSQPPRSFSFLNHHGQVSGAILRWLIDMAKSSVLGAWRALGHCAPTIGARLDFPLAQKTSRLGKKNNLNQVLWPGIDRCEPLIRGLGFFQEWSRVSATTTNSSALEA